jgi:hypothetical protein
VVLDLSVEQRPVTGELAVAVMRVDNGPRSNLGRQIEKRRRLSQ